MAGTLNVTKAVISFGKEDGTSFVAKCHCRRSSRLGTVMNQKGQANLDFLKGAACVCAPPIKQPLSPDCTVVVWYCYYDSYACST